MRTIVAILAILKKVFCGPRTMLRLRRAAYKLKLYGTGTQLKLSSVFEGMRSLEHARY